MNEFFFLLNMLDVKLSRRNDGRKGACQLVCGRFALN